MDIVFKNLNPSDFIKRTAEMQIGSVLRQHSLQGFSNLKVTVEMENSPFRKGADFYTVSFDASGMKELHLEKSSISLTAAIGNLANALNVYLEKSKQRIV